LTYLDPSLTSDAAVPPSMTSLSSATADWLAMDPRQKRVVAREACMKLARVVATKTPLVLVFEDAHWIDRDSEEVLRAMAALAADAAVLVVLTYRPEYDDSWLPTVGGTRLRMAPLGEDDVRRALADWFVEGPETDRLIDRLTQRSGGNPLFVEECVRSLAQEGALTTLVVGSDGTTARRRYACWEAPESIRAAVDRRHRLAHRPPLAGMRQPAAPCRWSARGAAVAGRRRLRPDNRRNRGRVAQAVAAEILFGRASSPTSNTFLPMPCCVKSPTIR
jgi:hypothetical protein